MISVETISFCNRCGRCCNPIALVSHTIGEIKKIFEDKRKGVFIGGNLKFAIENWEMISEEEALNLNPEIQSFLDRKKDTPFFVCKQFDRETKLCKIHQTRPRVCSRFPFYDLDYTLLPSSFPLYTKECGYKRCMLEVDTVLGHVESIYNKPIVRQEIKRSVMKKLEIYEFQAKRIEDTLRLVANLLKSHSRETSLDRDIMQSYKMIQNVLSGDIDKPVPRIVENLKDCSVVEKSQ